MSERLTDGELAELGLAVSAMDGWRYCDDALRALAELRALRLIDADREALEQAKFELRTWCLGGDHYDPDNQRRCAKVSRAIEWLSRLLSQGGGK